MSRSSKKIQENSLFPYQAVPQDPAEAASKEEYRRRLAEYLKDPAFRQIEGFPLGTDEDILALSDPPHYTACPNPFLPEILEHWQEERKEIRKSLGLPDDTSVGPGIKYRREPFAADVSEGKNDPIYNAHSYHTKVPHKAIMHYILHYTDPGDIVFDGFCGTGMTGVAAQLCRDKKAIEELGYQVHADDTIIDESGKPISRLGARKAVLNDLSPVATFISYNYNNPVDPAAFERETRLLMKKVESELGWMYNTWHPNCDDANRLEGKINFTIWSDVFICPQCSGDMVFWDVAVDKTTRVIKDEWICPNCHTKLAKNPAKGSGALKVEQALNIYFDQLIGQTVRQVRQVPVLINYSVGDKRLEKDLDSSDLSVISRIEDYVNPNSYPSDQMMFKGEQWGDSWRSGYHFGITNVHHFYTKRSLIALSFLMKEIRNVQDKEIAKKLLFLWESLSLGYTKLNRYGATHFSQVNRYLSGTLYVSSLISEISVNYAYKGKIHRLIDVIKSQKNNSTKQVCNLTSSSTAIKLANSTFDYIFIDPPFGDNLMYSELNFIWEAWLRVFTNNVSEAIMNEEQKKKLLQYQALMQSCFSEFYRLLKPGHWMTVEFHNSQNSIWNAIQEALLFNGFIVADVRTLDKQQGSFKQVTTSNAVKQDLVISAYKPTEEFEKRFNAEGGSELGVWDFVRQHLELLPLPNLKSRLLESQPERMHYLLYDRMVAFHLVRGLTVPLSAGEFYAGLAGRYLSRDGMYFTSSQAAEYDRLRLKAERVEQLALFVTDEQSAIQWLRQELDSVSGRGPQIYGDLQPHFILQLHQEKYEQLPELKIILEQNFLQDETEHWYVPDLDHQADLEMLRNIALLHEFADYLKSRGKLRAFRAEAVRAGFSKAWKERQYELIIQVAERLPEQALQEDAKLKMYYDNALGRAGRQPKQETLF